MIKIGNYDDKLYDVLKPLSICNYILFLKILFKSSSSFFLILYLLSFALTDSTEFIAAFCTTLPSATNSLDYLVMARSHTA